MKRLALGFAIFIALTAGSVMASHHSALRYTCDEPLPPTCNWVLDYCEDSGEVPPPGQIPCEICHYYCEDDSTVTIQVRRPTY